MEMENRFTVLVKVVTSSADATDLRLNNGNLQAELLQLLMQQIVLFVEVTKSLIQLTELPSQTLVTGRPALLTQLQRLNSSVSFTLQVPHSGQHVIVIFLDAVHGLQLKERWDYIFFFQVTCLSFVK